MAEVIGIVGSGVGIASFVVQIGDSVVKLKRFADLMKQAPEDLRDLLRRIEELSGILNRINTMNQLAQLADADSDLIWDSLESCRKAAQNLSNIATELERGITKNNTKGKFKFALKKQNLDDLKKRVDEETMKVVMSQQLFQGIVLLQNFRKPAITQNPPSHRNSAVPKPQDQIINATSFIRTKNRQMVRELNVWKQPSIFSTLFGAVSFQRGNYTKRTAKKPGHDYIQARIFTPYWWANRVFEAQAFRASCGWDFSIRSYNIIPDDSLVFYYVRSSNMEGLKDLFTTRQASLFDVGLNGWTLLHWAFWASNSSTCQFLLEQGADHLARRRDKYFPVSLARQGVVEPWLSSLLSSTVENYGSLDFDEIPFFHPDDIGNSAETTDMILKAVYPPYYENSLKKRVLLASVLSRGGNIVYPDSLKLILGDDENYFESDFAEFLLFSVPLYEIALAWENRRELWDAWVPFFTEMVGAGANLNCVERGDTIFLQFLGAQIYHEADLMTHFLTFLKICSVDLLLYGKSEKQIQLQRNVRRNLPPWRLRRRNCPRTRLISFAYGPRVEDWHLWLSNPRDEYAGEFWHMIENSGKQMPGGWVDDVDYDSENSFDEYSDDGYVLDTSDEDTSDED